MTEPVGERLADILLDKSVENLEAIFNQFGVTEMLEKKHRLSDFNGEVAFALDESIRAGLTQVGLLSPAFVQGVLDPAIRDEKPAQFGEKVNEQLTVEQETDIDNQDGRNQILNRASIRELTATVINALRD